VFSPLSYLICLRGCFTIFLVNFEDAIDKSPTAHCSAYLEGGFQPLFPTLSSLTTDFGERLTCNT
jgi:hypothetical protein